MNSLKGIYGGWATKNPSAENERARKPGTGLLPDFQEQNKNRESLLPDSVFAFIHEDVTTSSFDDCDAEELKKRLVEAHRRNVRLGLEKDALRRKNERLEETLKETFETNKNVIQELHRQYQTNWGGHIKKLDEALVDTEREARVWHARFLKSRMELAESKRQTQLALDTTTKSEQQIVKLTETISRSTQQKDGNAATRDDDYFSTEFSELANAIQQWVFRHFRGAPDQRLETLSTLLKDSYETVALAEEPPKTSRAHLDALSAIVAHQLCARVFPQFRFLGVNDLHDPFLTLFNCIGGTDAQRQAWRARTMDLVFKHDSVTLSFNETVKMMAESLKGPLGKLAAKNSREEQRNRTLHGLVERVARLAVEVAQQNSMIELYKVAPGSNFDPELMEDAVAAAEEDEKEEQEGVVRVLLFPAILRKDYDPNGKSLAGAVVVLKAKVLADFS